MAAQIYNFNTELRLRGIPNTVVKFSLTSYNLAEGTALWETFTPYVMALLLNLNSKFHILSEMLFTSNPFIGRLLSHSCIKYKRVGKANMLWQWQQMSHHEWKQQ